MAHELNDGGELRIPSEQLKQHRVRALRGAVTLVMAGPQTEEHVEPRLVAYLLAMFPRRDDLEELIVRVQSEPTEQHFERSGGEDDNTTIWRMEGMISATDRAEFTVGCIRRAIEILDELEDDRSSLVALQ